MSALPRELTHPGAVGWTSLIAVPERTREKAFGYEPRPKWNWRLSGPSECMTRCRSGRSECASGLENKIGGPAMTAEIKRCARIDARVFLAAASGLTSTVVAAAAVGPGSFIAPDPLIVPSSPGGAHDTLRFGPRECASSDRSWSRTAVALAPSWEPLRSRGTPDGYLPAGSTNTHVPTAHGHAEATTRSPILRRFPFSPRPQPRSP